MRKLARTGRYSLVAVTAFMLGSATLPAAAATAIPMGSLFYVSVLNGTATTPCATSTSTLGTTTTCNAVVDSDGQLAVSDSQTHTALGKLKYDNSGNLLVDNQGTQTVGGSVSVSNFPGTQQVGGTVSVSSDASVDNLARGAGGALAVDPNLSKDSSGNLNVNIARGSIGTPIANRGKTFGGTAPACGLGEACETFQDVNMKVTYFTASGCSRYFFILSGAGSFEVNSAETETFAIPMDVTKLVIVNANIVSCDYEINVAGY